MAKKRKTTANQKTVAANSTCENDCSAFEEELFPISWENDVQQESDDDKIRRMLPLVLSSMREHGLYEVWKKFHEMVAAGIFPMKNIAYLLFLDVVRWYSSETTTTMRYDDVVSRFWRTGYKLFHGRFLRFMKRNRREIIIKDSRRGCFDPAESEINFAVPIQKVKKKIEGPMPPEEIKPGILQHMIHFIAEQSSSLKHKSCAWMAKK